MSMVSIPNRMSFRRYNTICGSSYNATSKAEIHTISMWRLPLAPWHSQTRFVLKFASNDVSLLEKCFHVILTILGMDSDTQTIVVSVPIISIG